MRSIAPRLLIAVAPCVVTALIAATAPAAAGPLGQARSEAGAQRHVVLVGHRHGYRHRYSYDGGTYVRAPFTRVKTRGYRWTSVDAPFASVRVRPWGTWVRAPFVDIYVPR